MLHIKAFDKLKEKTRFHIDMACYIMLRLLIILIISAIYLLMKHEGFI
jgi:hypothetical protein